MVSVSSKVSTFQAKTLTVDSQKNCYILNEGHLKNLQDWGSNFIELTPGNYRLKIRESTASYWSEEKKFQLEPWALLWIKVGKFIPKLTGVEVQETWCSLNGLNDEFVLEVKEKTTLTGYFFDTFKDDNEGQIILEIASVETTDGPTDEGSDKIGSGLDLGGAKPSIGSFGPGNDSAFITPGGRPGGPREEISFIFNFDDSQVEQAWEKIAAKTEAAVTVTGAQDSTVEARRWDQLETWLLTGYKTQTKDLAMQVARLELMMNTFKQQLEGNLQLTFRRWSTHFDGRLQNLVGRQIEEVTQGNLSVALEQLKLEILNQTSRLVQTEINGAKTEINQGFETQISTVRSDLTKMFETQIASLKEELTKSIETHITNTTSEFNKTIETQISTAKTELSKEIEVNIAAVKTEITKDIDTRITTVTTEINKDIDVTNLISNEVTESVKTEINKDIEVKIDARLTDIRGSISSLEKNIDSKLETIRVDFRGEVVSAILEQISNLIEEKTKLEIAKVDFNTYLAQIDARAAKYLDQLSQLEVNLIARINQGDTHLYNWVLEQLMTLKGCLADRQVLVDQLALFSNELKTRLDTAPCVNPATFKTWTPLPVEPQVLPGGNLPQLPSNS